MDDTLAAECRRDGIDLLVFAPTIIERCRDAGLVPDRLLSTEVQTADALETLRLLSAWGGADVAMVDHYGLGEAWETVIRGKVRESWQSMISPTEP